METPSMTEDDVRAAAERLVEFHERFAPLFGKEQAQDHAYTYVKGLMVCPERKSIEPIALNVGDGQVSALQKFINIAPWDYGDVQTEVQSVFADDLVPTAAGSSIGVVGVVDESGFGKKGDQSVGVARQYNGRLGKDVVLFAVSCAHGEASGVALAVEGAIGFLAAEACEGVHGVETAGWRGARGSGVGSEMRQTLESLH